METPKEKKIRLFLLGIRQAVLLGLDHLERFMEMNPRTSELRKEVKQLVIENSRLRKSQ
jgi:hypothetical protein